MPGELSAEARETIRSYMFKIFVPIFTIIGIVTGIGGFLINETLHASRDKAAAEQKLENESAFNELFRTVSAKFSDFYDISLKERSDMLDKVTKSTSEAEIQLRNMKSLVDRAQVVGNEAVAARTAINNILNQSNHDNLAKSVLELMSVKGGPLDVTTNRLIDTSSGVGDIRVSLYPPTKFKKQNPEAVWVLLNGDKDQLDFADVEFKEYLINECGGFPDAQGNFLRGIDLKDGSESEQGLAKRRLPGSFQPASTLSHHHTMFVDADAANSRTHEPLNVTINSYVAYKHSWGVSQPEYRMRQPYKSDLHRKPTLGKTSDFGGEENTPSNIAVYIYIRIK